MKRLIIYATTLIVRAIFCEGFSLQPNLLVSSRLRIHSKSNENSVSTRTTLKSTAQSKTSNTINTLKNELLQLMQPTKRGLTTTPQIKQTIESQLQNLEQICPLAEPARSPLMGGKWIVNYSTAPPPSNGKLGPFVGVARQIINLEEKTYVNYLSVPGEDIEKEWLSATLDATFEEWDGVLLPSTTNVVDNSNGGIIQTNINSNQEESGNGRLLYENGLTKFSDFISKLIKNTKNEAKEDTLPDYGATSWKVNFKTLTIKVFGLTIVQRKFEEGTSRVWKMTFLDEETRIVRAGRTGKEEDDVVFYMSRDE